MLSSVAFVRSMSSVTTPSRKTALATSKRVPKGATVGTVGESGSLAGPRLHFEIRWEGRAVDPIQWLRDR